MSQNRINNDKLERLINVLIADILDATDDDILNESKEDCPDIVKEIEKVRALYENARIKAAKKRLFSAREAVTNQKERQGKVIQFNPAEARRKLDKLLHDNPDAAYEFTLAARKGSELSDTDVLGMLEDLQELGVYRPEDDPESCL